MATTLTGAAARTAESNGVAQARVGPTLQDPAFQAFWILRLGFIAAPILSGSTSSSTCS